MDLRLKLPPYKFHRFLVVTEREFSHEMHDLCAACKNDFDAFMNGAEIYHKEDQQ